MDDNQNMNDEFNKICEKVNKQLDKRRNYGELLDKGIIKSNPIHVSPGLQQLQSQIKFQKTSSQLDRKLENRPTINDLYDHHILENSPLSNLAPSLQSKKKYLQFLQTQSQLLQKLDHRPTPSQLIDSSIFKDNSLSSISYNHPNIKSYSSTPPLLHDNSDIFLDHQFLSFPENENDHFKRYIETNFELDEVSSTSSRISTTPPSLSSSPNSFLSASDLFSMVGPRYNSFDETIKIMNLKLENRINHEILIQKGIIKSTLEIAPSIQATQSLLKFQSISNSIDNKLDKRPVLKDFVNGNIYKNERKPLNQTNQNNSNIKPNPNNFNYNNLNYKIENRPSFEDLVNYNILKDPILFSQKNHLKFIQTRNRLNSKVENRPPVDILIKNHILIQNNIVNYNNNDTTTKIILQDKLNNRPTKEFLERNNILSPNNEIQFSYDDEIDDNM